MSDVATLDDYAAELLTAANTALATTSGGAISRSFVANALPALDCCPQLTVDVRSLTFETTAPTSPLPAIGHRVTMSGLILATLVITAVRCSPGPDSRGNPPPIDAMRAVSMLTNEDVWAIWNTLSTLKREGLLFGGKCPALYLDPPVPVNAEGMCAGWVFQVRVAIDGYTPVIPS